MFESVAPDVKEVRQQRARFYRTLPASLLLHGVVILAVPLGASWRVEFPTHSPAQWATYNLAEIPPPPPPPPPPAPPKVQAVPVQKVVIPEEIVAPNVIPDEIVPVTEEPPPPVETVAEGVEGGIEGGIEGGVVGGTEGGVEGSVVALTPPAPVVDNGRVVIPRDEKLDMYPLSKDYPVYPGKAQKNRWQDQLVVRYVIGTNGRVKEATVIQRAERDLFEHAALEAIRTWRFRPMIKDGKKVEVVHELTVFFRLRQAS